MVLTIEAIILSLVSLSRIQECYQHVEAMRFIASHLWWEIAIREVREGGPLYLLHVQYFSSLQWRMTRIRDLLF